MHDLGRAERLCKIVSTTRRDCAMQEAEGRFTWMYDMMYNEHNTETIMAASVGHTDPREEGVREALRQNRGKTVALLAAAIISSPVH